MFHCRGVGRDQAVPGGMSCLCNVVLISASVIIKKTKVSAMGANSVAHWRNTIWLACYDRQRPAGFVIWKPWGTACLVQSDLSIRFTLGQATFTRLWNHASSWRYSILMAVLKLHRCDHQALVFACGSSQFPPTQLCSNTQDANKALSSLHDVRGLQHMQATITRPLKFWDLFYCSKAKQNWKSTPEFILFIFLSPFS